MELLFHKIFQTYNDKDKILMRKEYQIEKKKTFRRKSIPKLQLTQKLKLISKQGQILSKRNFFMEKNS